MPTATSRRTERGLAYPGDAVQLQSTGTPNLVITRSFRSVALFLTRLAHFAHGDPGEYARLRATLIQDGMLRDVDGILVLERDI